MSGVFFSRLTDLCFSFEAEEGPLSSSGGRDFSSKLSLHLRYEARKEASPSEVRVCFCYVVLCFIGVHVSFGATVTFGTRGAGCFLYPGVQGLKYTQIIYNARFQVNYGCYFECKWFRQSNQKKSNYDEGRSGGSPPPRDALIGFTA